MSMDELSSRSLCFRMLENVYKNQAYSNLVIHQHFSGAVSMEEKDKSFISALFYGVITRSFTLDYYIDLFNSKKKSIDLSVRIILRMGIWQLLYSHSIPEYAAVHTSVELAKKHVHSGASSYVNGVLRTVLREKDKLLEQMNDIPFFARYSISKEISGLIIKWYGKEKASRIAESLLKRPQVTLRTNILRTQPSELIDILENEGLAAKISLWMNQAIVVDLAESSLFALQSFKDGLYMVQGESAMMVGQIAKPQANDKILDICAAPGGKTCHMAELTGDRADIFAMDVNKSRLELINQNTKRLGISSVHTIEADATQLCDTHPHFIEAFDKVIVDVPCSGLGLLAKKPDIRLTMTYLRIMDLLPLQQAILEQASSCVKPGGTLIYSTCTINPDENEKQVEQFLKRHHNFEIVSVDADIPQVLKDKSERISLNAKNGQILFLPDETECDGFFIAKMRRKYDE